jgi:putative thioredoxin
MTETKNHEVQDFERDVIDASNRQPVLVDFWAPWCGPCRTLGPVLERLDAEANGRWRLAKVDTDRNPEVSASYGIRGIPAVKLFVGGRVVAEFTGALPEHAVRQWLEEHLPNETKERIGQARQHMASGELEAARPLLVEALRREPESEDARAMLALLLALEDPNRATALVEGLSHRPEAEPVRTLAGLLAQDPDSLPEASVRQAYADALSALRQGEVETALERFIGVVQRDRQYENDGARRASVALFTALGDQHAAVQRLRPVFNRSLY